MSCFCDKDGIVIIKGNDTDFNGQEFLTFILDTRVLDLSSCSANFSLCGITKTFQDLSSGEIKINYNAIQTNTFPLGPTYGILKIFDSSGKVATIESRIPFLIKNSVHGDAIAVKPYEYTINVEQGGETILNVKVEAGVSVDVGETETLPSGSSAYVQNVGTPSHLVLKFGIPQGEKGEDGEAGPEGPDGPAGKDAKINGVNTLTLNTTNGLTLTQSGNVATLSGKSIQDSVTTEATNRSNADNNLQQQIDAIAASSDVTDIVGTHSDLENYDTSKLKDNDIIKVLQDETEGDATTYYRWSTHTNTFTLIGEEGPYYTKSDADSKFVPQTRTVNNKALNQNITLGASDVGAATAAQGAKADTAVQPSDLGSAAYENVNSFATAAQGTKADTSIQGVQINGTDLTPDANNKVNIPKASVNDLGVVKTNQSYGITIANDGLVYVYNADDTAIVGKTSAYRPITPSKLDKAVMEGLGDNSLTWSDAYKLSACKTIGTISGVQINSADLTPDSTTNKVNIPEATTSKLGVIKKLSSTTVTLTSAGWSSNTQTVTVSGMTSSVNVWVSPEGSSMTDYADGGVYCSAQGTDSLTFTCSTTPTNDLTVNVIFG